MGQIQTAAIGELNRLQLVVGGTGGEPVADGDAISRAGDAQYQAVARADVADIFQCHTFLEQQAVMTVRIAAVGGVVVVDGVSTVAQTEQVGVVTGTAVQTVVTGAAIQSVVAGITIEGVVTFTTEQLVGSATTTQCVIASITVQHIVGLSAL